MARKGSSTVLLHYIHRHATTVVQVLLTSKSFSLDFVRVNS